MDAATAFALVAVTHAGFQVTVTTLVYPALAEVGAARWTEVHAAHSRRIVPLVVLIYGAAVLTGAWWAVDGPDGFGWAALVLTALVLFVTAVAAAPLHGRLMATDPQLASRLRLLLRVDRLRCLVAVAAAVAAVVALS